MTKKAAIKKKVKGSKLATSAMAKVLARGFGNPGAPFWTQRQITEGFNKLKRAKEYQRRRSLCQEFMSSRPPSSRVSPKDGYLFLPKGELEGIDAMIDYCRGLFAKRESLDLDKMKGKKFLIDLMALEEYDTAHPLFDFVLSDRVLELACDYLGMIPQIEAIQVLWTPVNSTSEGSQQYHLDYVASQQLKFFVNLLDVTPESGPFSFLPKDVSDRVMRKAGRDLEKMEDEAVYRHCSEKDVKELIGPAGSAAAVDTSRCLHFGARSRGVERFVCIFNFVSYFIDLGDSRVPRVPKDYPLDEVRKLVLCRD